MKKLIREHAEQRRQYEEYRNIDADLCSQPLINFEDTYLFPLKHAFTGYSGMKMLLLLIHLYGQYARILDTDLAKNGTKLREALNPNKPLEILYTSLNECVDYATVVVNPVT